MSAQRRDLYPSIKGGISGSLVGSQNSGPSPAIMTPLPTLGVSGVQVENLDFCLYLLVTRYCPLLEWYQRNQLKQKVIQNLESYNT